MKRILIFLLVVAFSFAGFSQKIKIKKGKVLLDKVESAYIDEISSQAYQYSYLDGKKPAFSVKLVSKKISDTLTKQWIEVTSGDGSKKTEVEYEILSFSFSMKKILTDLMMKKYKLIAKGGINSDNVTAFFNEERPSISKEINELEKVEIKQAIKDQKVREERKAEFVTKKVKVDYYNQLIFKGDIPYNFYEEKPEKTRYPNLLGRYTFSKIKSSYSSVITIYDADNNKVAVVNEGGIGGNEVNLVHKKEKFTYKPNKTRTSTKRDIGEQVYEIAENLYINGVYLGNQVANNKLVNKSLAKENQKEEVEKYKHRTINIYDAQGYYIDENGKKVEGLVTMLFENVKNNYGVDITKHDQATLGGEAVIKTKDNSKTIKARSSKGVVCVTKDGKEICFQSIATKFLGMKSYNFAILLEKKNQNIQFYKGYENGFYYLKSPERDYAIMLSKTSAKSNSKSISKYLKCKEVREPLKSLDYLNINDLYKIEELYNNLCKK